jgi:hypothetical protein
LPGFEAVKAYVLGPPRSLKSIRKEDPSKGQGYGLHADLVSLLGALEWEPTPGNAAPPGPFAARHRISLEEARLDPFFREIYGFSDDPLGDAGPPWRRIDDEWLGGVSSLALQLDRGVNNTSLALAFELPNGQTLIFPGDAQMGNWLSWETLTFREQGGKKLPVKTRELLNRALLYKVGHHGSHNATLRPGGLEAMTNPGLVAMIPTDQAFAARKRPPEDGWKMPPRALLEALETATQGRVLSADRVDEAALAKSGAWREPPGRVRYATETFPKDGETARPLFTEYQLPF